MNRPSKKVLQMKPLIFVLFLILLITAVTTNSLSTVQEHFIRVNQLGFVDKDLKKAIVLSTDNLHGKRFLVRDLRTNETAFTGQIGPATLGAAAQSPFEFNHIVDFSSLETSGSYRIELEDGTTSLSFKIADDVYKPVIDDLLFFLKVNRCGNTQPEMHDACHLDDGTNTDFDLTGGWHDAGDFLKFTRSISYVTYTLLLSYAINTPDFSKFFYDHNHNGVADVLDEAKVGLDYLVKVYPDEDTFVIRVGDFEADHSQGPRMPQNDRLAKTDRPALFKFDRNELGLYAFTMALASSVYRDTPNYRQESEHYLELAKRAYFKAKSVGTGGYDKLCLAATELYRATQEDIYLTEAKRFDDRLSGSNWGNWSDQTNLAHARLGNFYHKAVDKLRGAVRSFDTASRNNLFGYDVPYEWSGLYVAISSGSAAWFYQLLTNDHAYDDLALRIRDYLLGVNPWGLCFIAGLGAHYPKNIHHSLALSLKRSGALKNDTITGAIPGGPFNRRKFEAEWNRLIPKGEDIYAEFQPPECVYYDHFKAYPTNEPCIYGSSEAILFFSFYLRFLPNANL